MAEERYIDEKYKKSAQEETYEAKLKRLEKTREMFEDLGGKKSVKHYES